MILKLSSRRAITPSTVEFWFECESPLKFQPGQFLRWVLPHDQPDERGASRFFSIASSPTESKILLATKLSAEGSSFKRRLGSMRPGETLEAFGPMGGFTLPNNPDVPVMLVAGGIGVTPYRSMIKWLADTGRQTPVYLLYASRTANEIAFKPEFDRWAAALPGLKLTYLVQQADQRWPGETGRLKAKRILDATQGGKPLIYLSGPQPMIESLKQGLLELDVPVGQIKTDFFPGYREI